MTAGLRLGIGAVTVVVFAVGATNLYQAGQLGFAALVAGLAALRAAWWLREAWQFRARFVKRGDSAARD